MTTTDETAHQRLLRRGLRLEYTTLAWNVVGVVVLAVAAIAASSVALASFGLDSLIEIGASTVVIWELTDTAAGRERLALRLIGWSFFAIAAYVAAQASYLLAAGDHPHHSYLGIAWTAASFAVMLALAYGKAVTGKALDNTVLRTEGRVTLVDACGRLVVGRPGRRLRDRFLRGQRRSRRPPGGPPTLTGSLGRACGVTEHLRGLSR